MVTVPANLLGHPEVSTVLEDVALEMVPVVGELRQVEEIHQAAIVGDYRSAAIGAVVLAAGVLLRGARLARLEQRAAAEVLPGVRRGVRPHPKDALVEGGHRGRYQAALGHEQLARLPKKWDVHHSLPQEYRTILEKAGIDIDSPKHLRGVQGSSFPGKERNVHQHITNEWAEWQRALDLEGRHPTAEDIVEQARYIDWKYGFAFWENKARL